jgi:hypothetical protein
LIGSSALLRHRSRSPNRTRTYRQPRPSGLEKISEEAIVIPILLNNRLRTPMRRRYALFAAAALLLGHSLPLSAQPAAPEVTVAKPVSKRVARWDEYIGQFQAQRRVEVRARVSGELVNIHFTDGLVVKAGDILFTIDPRPFAIAVESARAEVVRAKAQAALTSTDLERAKQLAPSKVLTLRDVDQRQANSDIAKAQLDAAEATTEVELFIWSPPESYRYPLVRACRTTKSGDPGSAIQLSRSTFPRFLCFASSREVTHNGQDQRQHRREDRAFDEEMRELHRGFPPSGWPISGPQSLWCRSRG